MNIIIDPGFEENLCPQTPVRVQYNWKLCHCNQENITFNAAAAAKLIQLCLTLCDPIDGSPPSYPVPGILQARTLEWAAISLSNAWK